MDPYIHMKTKASCEVKVHSTRFSQPQHSTDVENGGVLCRVLLERSLARQLTDELRLQYRYSTGGTVPVRIDLDQIDKFSSDTMSLRTIQYGGPCSM